MLGTYTKSKGQCQACACKLSMISSTLTYSYLCELGQSWPEIQLAGIEVAAHVFSCARTRVCFIPPCSLLQPHLEDVRYSANVMRCSETGPQPSIRSGYLARTKYVYIYLYLDFAKKKKVKIRQTFTTDGHKGRSEKKRGQETRQQIVLFFDGLLQPSSLGLASKRNKRSNGASVSILKKKTKYSV